MYMYTDSYDVAIIVFIQSTLNRVGIKYLAHRQLPNNALNSAIHIYSFSSGRPIVDSRLVNKARGRKAKAKAKARGRKAKAKARGRKAKAKARGHKAKAKARGLKNFPEV